MPTTLLMKKRLELHQVEKSYRKKQVLSHISFTLAQGEILGLFGKNGCGKSTLLKILFGTVKADVLKLQLDGRPMDPKRVIPQQQIGYLPQDSFLPKHLTVREIIPLFYEDGEGQDLIFRAPFVEKIAKRKAGTLSVGEIRYLELHLIANLNHPFLLLDEPFSMIAPLYKEKITAFLLTLKDKKGMIITDHYYPDVLGVSTKNLLITQGIATPIHDAHDLRRLGYLKKR